MFHALQPTIESSPTPPQTPAARGKARALMQLPNVHHQRWWEPTTGGQRTVAQLGDAIAFWENSRVCRVS